MNTIMYRNNIIKYILTLLLGASVNVVINAQNFSTIGEIKRLTSNTHFTITFQPNTVQVAMLERMIRVMSAGLIYGMVKTDCFYLMTSCHPGRLMI